MNSHLLIAIDGPAGAGKSTVAKRVARRLEIPYVDTGSMYRTIAWLALQESLTADQEEEISELALSTPMTLVEGGVKVRDVVLKDELRTSEISNFASTIAAMPRVREALVRKQQEIAQVQSVVMDGRDIGTHVLPQAHVKVFLTASIEERARRRFEELQGKNQSPNYKKLLQEIKQRDENDRNRTFSPLRQAKDAILIDSTDQTIEEMVEMILELCCTKMGGAE
ncbi:(d)CMP kinase [Baia soyae]|uniref:Cytidylate kinase n=1 Tax=Baia soyae TaxID=1544746 RepID=A0A4R2S2D8_9BACL|nr:(d)CMP kinase [Baia soyae]TCP69845.1 cytidylate kinase [Baia soyae]